MSERLSPRDASYLYREDATAPAHVGNLAVFSPGRSELTYDGLLETIERRLSEVPRYRQRLRGASASLSRPTWEEDPRFDLRFHVRRSALPRPGNDAQLRELVARIMSRRLDRTRPLWEMYLVEGLRGGRLAVLWKTHEALVEGSGIDLGQVILSPPAGGKASANGSAALEHAVLGSALPDGDAVDRAGGPDRAPFDGAEGGEVASATRDPASKAGLPAVSAWDQLTDALGELARQPARIVAAAWAGNPVSALAGVAGSVLSAARTAARPAPSSPLNVPIGEQRRFAVVRTRLSDYRAIRDARSSTVNDVVLATIAGALRSWLMARGESVKSQDVLRALVPIGVREGAPISHSVRAGTTRVSSVLVDLPIGEPNPAVRLHQVSYAMAAQRQTGQFVDAGTLIGLSGFAPPTLHALGAKAALGFSRRLYNLIITNVPGTSDLIYLRGARMLASYPVLPLAQGQALSIGVTSYHGGVFYGVNADADVVPDIHVLADLISESLAELKETVG